MTICLLEKSYKFLIFIVINIRRRTLKFYAEIEKRLAEQLIIKDFKSLVTDKNLEAQQAFKILLCYFLSVMKLNEEEILFAKEGEFVHDYRVALRRSRVILGEAQDIFPEFLILRFKNYLSTLGQRTALKRDMEVLIEKKEAYIALLDTEDEKKNLALMFEDLHFKENAAYKKLIRYMHTKAYQGILEKWNRFLEDDKPFSELFSSKPILETAVDKTLRRARKFNRKGLKLSHNSKDEAFHNLRIAAKKLRYLLEFFYFLFGKKISRPLVAAVKEFQSCLGDFQDYSVHQEEIKNWIESKKHLSKYAPTIEAAKLLIEKMEEEKHKLREEFFAMQDQMNSKKYINLWDKLSELSSN